jgi:hypothetical protein
VGWHNLINSISYPFTHFLRSIEVDDAGFAAQKVVSRTTKTTCGFGTASYI